MDKVSPISAFLKDDSLSHRFMLKMMKELVEAEAVFAPYRDVFKVSIFGSARTQEHEEDYQLAKDLAKGCTDNNWMVITGAGPGIMQAGNQGAADGHSFGLRIELPFENEANDYIKDNHKCLDFDLFFTRKLFFVKEAQAIVALPGGFGTLDEIFESLTLIQTGKSPMVPVVLLDDAQSNYWDKIDWFSHDNLVKQGLISKEDPSLFFHAHTAEEAIAHIKSFYHKVKRVDVSDEQLLIYLKDTLTADNIKCLSEEFADLDASTWRLGTAHDVKHESVQGFVSCALNYAMAITPAPTNYGRIRQLIDAINQMN